MTTEPGGVGSSPHQKLRDMKKDRFLQRFKQGANAEANNDAAPDPRDELELISQQTTAAFQKIEMPVAGRPLMSLDRTRSARRSQDLGEKREKLIQKLRNDKSKRQQPLLSRKSESDSEVGYSDMTVDANDSMLSSEHVYANDSMLSSEGFSGHEASTMSGVVSLVGAFTMSDDTQDVTNYSNDPMDDANNERKCIEHDSDIDDPISKVRQNSYEQRSELRQQRQESLTGVLARGLIQRSREHRSFRSSGATSIENLDNSRRDEGEDEIQDSVQGESLTTKKRFVRKVLGVSSLRMLKSEEAKPTVSEKSSVVESASFDTLDRSCHSLDDSRNDRGGDHDSEISEKTTKTSRSRLVAQGISRIRMRRSKDNPQAVRGASNLKVGDSSDALDDSRHEKTEDIKFDPLKAETPFEKMRRRRVGKVIPRSRLHQSIGTPLAAIKVSDHSVGGSFDTLDDSVRTLDDSRHDDLIKKKSPEPPRPEAYVRTRLSGSFPSGDNEAEARSPHSNKLDAIDLFERKESNVQPLEPEEPGSLLISNSAMDASLRAIPGDFLEHVETKSFEKDCADRSQEVVYDELQHVIHPTSDYSSSAEIPLYHLDAPADEKSMDNRNLSCHSVCDPAQLEATNEKHAVNRSRHVEPALDASPHQARALFVKVATDFPLDETPSMGVVVSKRQPGAVVGRRRTEPGAKIESEKRADAGTHSLNGDIIGIAEFPGKHSFQTEQNEGENGPETKGFATPLVNGDHGQLLDTPKSRNHGEAMSSAKLGEFRSEKAVFDELQQVSHPTIDLFYRVEDPMSKKLGLYQLNTPVDEMDMDIQHLTSDSVCCPGQLEAQANEEHTVTRSGHFEPALDASPHQAGAFFVDAAADFPVDEMPSMRFDVAAKRPDAVLERRRTEPGTATESEQVAHTGTHSVEEGIIGIAEFPREDYFQTEHIEGENGAEFGVSAASLALGEHGQYRSGSVDFSDSHAHGEARSDKKAEALIPGTERRRMSFSPFLARTSSIESLDDSLLDEAQAMAHAAPTDKELDTVHSGSRQQQLTVSSIGSITSSIISLDHRPLDEPHIRSRAVPTDTEHDTLPPGRRRRRMSFSSILSRASSFESLDDSLPDEAKSVPQARDVRSENGKRDSSPQRPNVIMRVLSRVVSRAKILESKDIDDHHHEDENFVAARPLGTQDRTDEVEHAPIQDVSRLGAAPGARQAEFDAVSAKTPLEEQVRGVSPVTFSVGEPQGTAKDFLRFANDQDAVECDRRPEEPTLSYVPEQPGALIDDRLFPQLSLSSNPVDRSRCTVSDFERFNAIQDTVECDTEHEDPMNSWKSESSAHLSLASNPAKASPCTANEFDECGLIQHSVKAASEQSDFPAAYAFDDQPVHVEVAEGVDFSPEEGCIAPAPIQALIPEKFDLVPGALIESTHYTPAQEFFQADKAKGFMQNAPSEQSTIESPKPLLSCPPSEPRTSAFEEFKDFEAFNEQNESVAIISHNEGCAGESLDSLLCAERTAKYAQQKKDRGLTIQTCGQSSQKVIESSTGDSHGDALLFDYNLQVVGTPPPPPPSKRRRSSKKEVDVVFDFSEGPAKLLCEAPEENYAPKVGTPPPPPPPPAKKRRSSRATRQANLRDVAPDSPLTMDIAVVKPLLQNSTQLMERRHLLEVNVEASMLEEVHAVPLLALNDSIGRDVQVADPELSGLRVVARAPLLTGKISAEPLCLLPETLPPSRRHFRSESGTIDVLDELTTVDIVGPILQSGNSPLPSDRQFPSETSRSLALDSMLPQNAAAVSESFPMSPGLLLDSTIFFKNSLEKTHGEIENTLAADSSTSLRDHLASSSEQVGPPLDESTLPSNSSRECFERMGRSNTATNQRQNQIDVADNYSADSLDEVKDLSARAEKNEQMSLSEKIREGSTCAESVERGQPLSGHDVRDVEDTSDETKPNRLLLQDSTEAKEAQNKEANGRNDKMADICVIEGIQPSDGVTLDVTSDDYVETRCVSAANEISTPDIVTFRDIKAAATGIIGAGVSSAGWDTRSIAAHPPDAAPVACDLDAAAWNPARVVFNISAISSADISGTLDTLVCAGPSSDSLAFAKGSDFVESPLGPWKNDDSSTLDSTGNAGPTWSQFTFEDGWTEIGEVDNQGNEPTVEDVVPLLKDESERCALVREADDGQPSQGERIEAYNSTVCSSSSSDEGEDQDDDSYGQNDVVQYAPHRSDTETGIEDIFDHQDTSAGEFSGTVFATFEAAATLAEAAKGEQGVILAHSTISPLISDGTSPIDGDLLAYAPFSQVANADRDAGLPDMVVTESADRFKYKIAFEEVVAISKGAERLYLHNLPTEGDGGASQKEKIDPAKCNVSHSDTSGHDGGDENSDIKIVIRHVSHYTIAESDSEHFSERNANVAVESLCTDVETSSATATLDECAQHEQVSKTTESAVVRQGFARTPFAITNEAPTPEKHFIPLLVPSPEEKIKKWDEGKLRPFKHLEAVQNKARAFSQAHDYSDVEKVVQHTSYHNTNAESDSEHFLVRNANVAVKSPGTEVETSNATATLDNCAQHERESETTEGAVVLQGFVRTPFAIANEAPTPEKRYIPLLAPPPEEKYKKWEEGKLRPFKHLEAVQNKARAFTQPHDYSDMEKVVQHASQNKEAESDSEHFSERNANVAVKSPGTKVEKCNATAYLDECAQHERESETTESAVVLQGFVRTPFAAANWEAPTPEKRYIPLLAPPPEEKYKKWEEGKLRPFKHLDTVQNKALAFTQPHDYSDMEKVVQHTSHHNTNAECDSEHFSELNANIAVKPPETEVETCNATATLDKCSQHERERETAESAVVRQGCVRTPVAIANEAPTPEKRYIPLLAPPPEEEFKKWEEGELRPFEDLEPVQSTDRAFSLTCDPPGKSCVDGRSRESYGEGSNLAELLLPVVGGCQQEPDIDAGEALDDVRRPCFPDQPNLPLMTRLQMRSSQHGSSFDDAAWGELLDEKCSFEKNVRASDGKIVISEKMAEKIAIASSVAAERLEECLVAAKYSGSTSSVAEAKTEDDAGRKPLAAGMFCSVPEALPDRLVTGYVDPMNEEYDLSQSLDEKTPIGGAFSARKDNAVAHAENRPPPVGMMAPDDAANVERASSTLSTRVSLRVQAHTLQPSTLSHKHTSPLREKVMSEGDLTVWLRSLLLLSDVCENRCDLESDLRSLLDDDDNFEYVCALVAAKVSNGLRSKEHEYRLKSPISGKMKELVPFSLASRTQRAAVLAANFVSFVQRIGNLTGIASPFNNENPFVLMVVGESMIGKNEAYSQGSVQQLVFDHGGADAVQITGFFYEAVQSSSSMTFEGKPPQGSDNEKQVVVEGDFVRYGQRYKKPPNMFPSPFENATLQLPSVVLAVLGFLGDPVAVCRMKIVNRFCKRIISENEHTVMRDAVRAGGMSMNVRPAFWMWVTLEKCGNSKLEVPTKKASNLHQDHSSSVYPFPSKIAKLARIGREGPWHGVINRDVTRAFGNMPPHKTGAKLRADSIVRALVTFGQGRLIKRGVKGGGFSPPTPSITTPGRQKSKSKPRASAAPPPWEVGDENSEASDGSMTPTDTVSDWGGVSPVASFASSVGDDAENRRPPVRRGPVAIESQGNSTDQNSLDASREATDDLVLNGSALTAEMKIKLQNQLQFILHALAAEHEDVGYCQGMDYIVAHLLRVLQDTVRWRAAKGSLPSALNDLAKALPDQSGVISDEAINESLIVEDAVFRVMDCLFTTYNLRHIFWPELRSLKICCRVFERLVLHKLPVLADHFEHHELNVGLFALGWFQTLFLYLPSMPTATVCHIWDIWLVERSYKIFFRVGTAILFLSQPILLNHDLEGMMTYLNTFPDATLLKPDILIACALQIKVTNQMLTELELEVTGGH